jgi:hypothetical protein
MKYLALMISLTVLSIVGCGTTATSTATATATPAPRAPGEVTPRPAPEELRMDLGDGLVAAFVEGLAPEFTGKIAYVTHVPSGSQVVLDRQGQVVERHDGLLDGPALLDAVLADEAVMRRINANLQSDSDTRPRQSSVDWAHFIKFGGVTYLAKGSLVGPVIIEGERALTEADLGPVVFRTAFRLAGYARAPYHSQDGDAAHLDPGRPVFAVKGYGGGYGLATIKDGQVTLFEIDSNPAARSGLHMLDIQNKVSYIGINSTDSGRPELARIDDPETVDAMVNMALMAAVDQSQRARERGFYYLAFHRKDGTAVVRPFWTGTGELARGVMTPVEFQELVLEVLDGARTPAQ